MHYGSRVSARGNVLDRPTIHPVIGVYILSRGGTAPLVPVCRPDLLAGKDTTLLIRSIPDHKNEEIEFHK